MGYADPVHPAVYVDGNYVGTTPITIPVTQATHTVYLSTPTWDPYDPYGANYASFYYMYDYQNSNDYSDGGILPI